MGLMIVMEMEFVVPTIVLPRTKMLGQIVAMSIIQIHFHPKIVQLVNFATLQLKNVNLHSLLTQFVQIQ